MSQQDDEFEIAYNKIKNIEWQSFALKIAVAVFGIGFCVGLIVILTWL
jgi:hypothetical protein